MLERLRRRLVIVCTAATGLIAAAMAVAILLVAQVEMDRRARAEFVGDLRAVQFALEGQRVIGARWLAQTEFNHGVLLHIEQHGVPLRNVAERHRGEAARLTAIAREIADAAESAGEAARFVDPQSGVACLVGRLEMGGARVYVVKPLADLQVQAARLRRWVVGMVLGVLCALGLFAWWFVSRLMRPIRESRQRQADFIAAASHELRTPLAVIRAGIGAIRKAPEQTEHCLRLIAAEEARMAGLVDDLLTLAGADSGSPQSRLRLEEDELEPLLVSVYERFEEEALGKGIRLTLSPPEAPLPRCRVDRARIEQALSVLVDNAVCYTPTGGAVRIAAETDGNTVRLLVTDDGPGIPARHRPYLFDRFYRVDPARSDREHLGLGLSIAKEIAERHGGRIEYREAPGGGSEFALVLPCE